MSERVFKIGDRVTWMHCTSNGTRMGFSTREGVVTHTLKNSVWVKRNGKTENFHKSQLRHVNEKNEVTELVEDMAKESAKSKEAK